jgi:hypothetical protein
MYMMPAYFKGVSIKHVEKNRDDLVIELEKISIEEIDSMQTGSLNLVRAMQDGEDTLCVDYHSTTLRHRTGASKTISSL